MFHTPIHVEYKKLMLSSKDQDDVQLQFFQWLFLVEPSQCPGFKQSAENKHALSHSPTREFRMGSDLEIGDVMKRTSAVEPSFS